MANVALRPQASTLEEQRDPRWRVIRNALHEHRIGCRPRWLPDGSERCEGPNSVTHNRAASLILDALNRS